MKESTRAYLYRIALAAIPVLVAVGVMTESQAVSVAGLVAALFPVGLAVKHTSTDSKEA